MRKWLLVIVAVTLTSLLPALPVAGWVYRVPLVITNAGTTTYPMAPVVAPLNVSWLASNGFIGASGLDTRMETSAGLQRPHLLASDRVLTVAPSAPGSSVNYYMTTGNTPATAMAIIVGAGGYVTTADAAALEPGSDWELEISGYWRTGSPPAPNIDAVRKQQALRWFRPPWRVGYVAAEILQYGSDDYQLAYNTAAGVNASTWRGQTVTASADYHLAGVRVYAVHYAGSGNFVVQVRNVSGGVPGGTVLTSATVDAATLYPTGWHTIAFTLPLDITSGSTYALVCGATGTAQVAVYYHNGDPYAGGQMATSSDGGTTWTAVSGSDLAFECLWTPYVEAALADGHHRLRLVSSGGTFRLERYTTSWQVLATSAKWQPVPDRSSDWVWLAHYNAISYADYIKLTVGGTMVLHYEPTSIITDAGSGFVLPDRAGIAQDGIITWGSNPSGITVTLGSMEASGSGATIPPTPTPRDVMPGTRVSDWFGDGTVTKASTLSNPFRPFVRILSDTTSLTEIQAWRLIGFGLLMLVVVATARMVRGHQGITAIVASACLIGLVAFDSNIFPLWLVVLAIGGFIGGLVAERTASL